MSILLEAAIYLFAAIISVPISRALGFGSVLGYLAAGILIGPFGIALIHSYEHTMHFAEFGVVLLLFIIGLELKPSRLWVMRRMVFGLGALQVFTTAAAIAAIALLAGVPGTAAIVVGSALALSSTAFVLQMLAEKNALTTNYGRSAFAILLFQDLIVIPLIAIMPLLGDSAAGGGFDAIKLATSLAALALLIVGGRLLLRPVLEMVAKTSIPELFTATALLVVIGAALLMQFAGMSMVLGAFIAGMLLADSEYRHQLEADIAPFKGLLLGLFFIAVGMSVDLSLLVREPLQIVAIVAGLMGVKGTILFLLARPFGMCDRTGALRLAASMSQGGEFAFVIFALATTAGAMAVPLADTLTLAVTISMLLTPIIYAIVERSTYGKEDRPAQAFDEIEDDSNQILIAGFGRVGQIVGRMLRASGRPFTALEFDPDQVNLVRNYGNKVHFGDARHLGVLRAAGAGEAKLFVIATGGMETSLGIAATCKRHFPHLKIIARAHNRRHAHKLMALGVDYIFRDTLLSSVAMGEKVFSELGVDSDETRKLAELFIERDERLLREQYAIHDSEEKLIQTARETEQEMKTVLRGDIGN